MTLRVFISYVHDDQEVVDRICDELRGRGVDAWRDIDRLVGGDFWAERIREQIRDSDFFLAFFSKAYTARHRSYMTEELTQAIEELRQRRTRWFIPVLLSGTVPNWDIGAGKTLQSLQWIDFRGTELGAATWHLWDALGLPKDVAPRPIEVQASSVEGYLRDIAREKSSNGHLLVRSKISKRALRNALRYCRVPHDATILGLIDCGGRLKFWNDGKNAIVFTSSGIYYADDYTSGFIPYVSCRSYTFVIKEWRQLRHAHGSTYYKSHYWVCFPDGKITCGSTMFGPSASWVLSVLNGLRGII